MDTDSELLSEFLDSGSQVAFTALVQRHLAVVYSAALRQVGDAQRAEDVAQSVFALLARKAGSLRGHPALVGWLFTATAFTGQRMRRNERRRGLYEVPSAALDQTFAAKPDRIQWERTRPVIDQALLELKEADRDVVLMRFFEGCSYIDLARRMGLAENTARMRVDRALDRLRRTLARRGIASTAAALGAALAEQAVVAAPSGLAASVAAAAGSGAGSAAAVAFMSSAVIKTAILAAALAVAAGFVFEHARIGRLREENLRLRAEVAGAPRHTAAPVQAQGSAVQRMPSIDSHSGLSSGPIADGQQFAGPASVAPDPTKSLTKLSDFRNVGRATPAEAFQTIIWSAEHGDESLPGMLFLNQAARIQADEMIAGLPDSLKADYGTPQNLAALYLQAELEGIETLQFARVRQSDFETYEIDVASGEAGSGTREFSLQTTPTGWMLKIPAARLARFEQSLRKPPQ